MSWFDNTNGSGKAPGFAARMFSQEKLAYVAALGRPLQADPLGYPDGMSRYAWERSNPVTLLDPLGLCAEAGGRSWTWRERLDRQNYADEASSRLLNSGRGWWTQVLGAAAVQAAAESADPLNFIPYAKMGRLAGRALRLARGTRSLRYVDDMLRAMAEASESFARGIRFGAAAFARSADEVAALMRRGSGLAGNAPRRVSLPQYPGSAGRQYPTPEFAAANGIPICFVAGTDVLEGDGDFIDIEDLRVGRRVATDAGESNNGEVADDPNATRVDRRNWRLVTIRAEQTWADGTRDTWEVQTLQPVRWLRRRDVDAGEEIALDAVLDLEEMGAPEGLVGEVVSIDRTPAIERGPGRVVLTTVSHLSNFVYDLTLRGADGDLDTLGVTGWHKLYDEAEGWQSVCELSVGDTLRRRDGEQATVVSVERDLGIQRVYNMTVEADHVYYVGELTTLAHNHNCSLLPTGRPRQ